jgi:hypothetical protein
MDAIDLEAQLTTQEPTGWNPIVHQELQNGVQG